MANQFHEAGVYVIRNRKTGAAYVGATTNLSVRLEGHLSCIERDPKRALRGAFNKCTPDNIELRIIERVDVPRTADARGIKELSRRTAEMKHLLDRELHWIRTLKPSLNVRGTKCRRVDVAKLPVGPPPDMHVEEAEAKKASNGRRRREAAAAK